MHHPFTPELQAFIQRHINADTAELLLSATRHVGIDVPFAVDQIEARRRLRDKLPQWYANPALIMGGRVPAEQCSSELTARYKRTLVDGQSIADLTGGMGVDLWYMSEGLQQAIYTERQEHLCQAARHNFLVLADGHHPTIEVRHGDALLLPLPQVDTIYLDPARRSADGSRVFAIGDCQPNVLEWQDQLLRHAPTLLLKLSPMVDLTDALRRLRGVTEVHIVAVRNECKEVLIKATRAALQQAPSSSSHRQGPSTCTIHCVDFLATRTLHFVAELPTPGGEGFVQSGPQVTPLLMDEGLGSYLYEPDVTLMKTQLFGTLCQRFPVFQLDYDTHLFTSDQFVPDFPGRTFVVDEVIPFASKTLKRLKSHIPQANIATRNFPFTADQLRHRTAILDGGTTYLFGAKVNGTGNVLIQCHKAI